MAVTGAVKPIVTVQGGAHRGNDSRPAATRTTATMSSRMACAWLENITKMVHSRPSGASGPKRGDTAADVAAYLDGLVDFRRGNSLLNQGAHALNRIALVAENLRRRGADGSNRQSAGAENGRCSG